MKASRETTFTPVTLTLESQAELDAIYTVLNHTGLCEALGLSCDLWEILDGYSSEKSHELHKRVNEFRFTR